MRICINDPKALSHNVLLRNAQAPGWRADCNPADTRSKCLIWHEYPPDHGLYCISGVLRHTVLPFGSLVKEKEKAGYAHLALILAFLKPRKNSALSFGRRMQYRI